MSEKQPWKRPHNHNTNRGRALPQVMPYVEPDRDNWRESAACKGMDVNLFFPEAGGDGVNTAKAAKKICTTCPVSEPCLAYGLAISDRAGIFGGLTPRQRKFLKKDNR